jgi:hypothetical protein
LTTSGDSNTTEHCRSAAAAGRFSEPDLVPVRHGRMMVSPFTFYRGAAKMVAADLAGTAVAGLGAQLCGDAHLSNFGAFASPERRLRRPPTPRSPRERRPWRTRCCGPRS